MKESFIEPPSFGCSISLFKTKRKRTLRSTHCHEGVICLVYLGDLFPLSDFITTPVGRHRQPHLHLAVSKVKWRLESESWEKTLWSLHWPKKRHTASVDPNPFCGQTCQPQSPIPGKNPGDNRTVWLLLTVILGHPLWNSWRCITCVHPHSLTQVRCQRNNFFLLETSDYA